MEFVRLSKYAVHMMPTMEARVRRFMQGLSPFIINEATTTVLNSNMNYGRMVAFAQDTEARKLKLRMERESSSRARSAGNLGDSFGGGRSAFREGSSGPSQSYAQSSASVPPSGHGQQCGMRGHIQRECRASRQGTSRGTAQSSSPTTAISSAHPPARGSSAIAGCGTAGGSAQSSGGPSRFYAMCGRQSAEASSDVVIVRVPSIEGEGVGYSENSF
uniref:Uncharacterized protein n=1 Tax=Nicotiana tabacum TaxID=4097 RepID=A0A1S4AXA6_TOBAC|nr:PREDICTED: uncharacterized protein LOC107802300 [Nicotiana tabacum]